MINEDKLRSLLQQLIVDYSRESQGLAKIYLERLDKVFEDKDSQSTSANEKVKSE